MSSKLIFRSWRRRLQLFGGSPAPSSPSSASAASGCSPPADRSSAGPAGPFSRRSPLSSPRPARSSLSAQSLATRRRPSFPSSESSFTHPPSTHFYTLSLLAPLLP